MAYRVKKFRGYRRMLRKLIRVVEDYQPDWRPDEADGREEFLELDLYSHRFFHPRGKGRKALFSPPSGPPSPPAVGRPRPPEYRPPRGERTAGTAGAPAGRCSPACPPPG